MITDKQWTVLTMIIADGLSYRQAAENLHISKSTVQDFMNRSRKKTIGEMLDKMAEHKPKPLPVHTLQYNEDFADNQVKEQF